MPEKAGKNLLQFVVLEESDPFRECGKRQWFCGEFEVLELGSAPIAPLQSFRDKLQIEPSSRIQPSGGPQC
jgi:hypothetical protein